jgi:hypothetical protein
MGFRKFTDRDRQLWEIRPLSRDAWELSPSGGNPARPRTVAAPGYEQDPYELSIEELQGLLDASAAAPPRARKNPFGE